MHEDFYCGVEHFFITLLSQLQDYLHSSSQTTLRQGNRSVHEWTETSWMQSRRCRGSRSWRKRHAAAALHPAPHHTVPDTLTAPLPEGLPCKQALPSSSRVTPGWAPL